MVIDNNGLRANVGIVLVNKRRQLFWGRSVRQGGYWQFPQGGIKPNETPLQALYRELEEEVGLTAAHVTCISQSKEWLAYYIPKKFIRYNSLPLCLGQKQKWFLLRLDEDEAEMQFDVGYPPEFDGFRWVSYWYPVHHIVNFKKKVYYSILKEFSKAVFSHSFLTHKKLEQV